MSTTTILKSDAGYAGQKLNLWHFGGSVAMRASQHLQALRLTASSATLTTGSKKLLTAGTLAIDGSSTHDLADNDMVVQAGDYTTITSLIRNARDGGLWDG